MKKMYERICKGLCERISQKKREEKVFPKLEYAGISEDFDLWLGKRMLAVMLIGFIGFLLPLTVGKYFYLLDFTGIFMPVLVAIGTGIGFAAVSGFFFYLHLYYVIEGRAALVESILPDFMLLVSSNISAGMTPFSAFRAGARKEFGPLSEEIKKAFSKSLGTRSFSAALKQVSTKIKSRALTETISFFTQAMKSGGKLTKLLETSAMDLKQTQEMKEELRSSTRMYVIFVVFVIVIATPLLLSVSVQFLTMITSIQEDAQAPQGDDMSSVSFLSTELKIKPDFMLNMAYVLLAGNALLAGLFIGVLGDGKAIMGLKYSPVILAASIGGLIGANVLLGQFLGI